MQFVAELWVFSSLSCRRRHSERRASQGSEAYDPYDFNTETDVPQSKLNQQQTFYIYVTLNRLNLFLMIFKVNKTSLKNDDLIFIWHKYILKWNYIDNIDWYI